MTKEQLIWTVINEVIGQHPNQDSSKQAHPQEITFEVEKAYNTIVKQFFADPKNSNDADLNYYSKSFTVSITAKAGMEDTFIAVLPVQPIALPSGMGLLRVLPKDSDAMIERITEGQWHSLKHLESYCCGPAYAFVDIDSNQVVFKFNRPEYKMISQVVLKIIPVFSAIDDEDVINTPMGDAAITQMVLELIGHRPTDNTNDDEK